MTEQQPWITHPQPSPAPPPPWTANPQPSPAPSAWDSYPQPSPAVPANRPPTWILATGAAAAVLIAGVAGFVIGRGTAGSLDEQAAAAPTASATPRLQAAYDACSPKDSDDTLQLADEGRTIVIDTGSEYGDPTGMDCVLDVVGTPESITAEMGRTTAMMGVQDAEHDGISYSWSYHPDNGVDMVITEAGPGA